MAPIPRCPAVVDGVAVAVVGIGIPTARRRRRRCPASKSCSSTASSKSPRACHTLPAHAMRHLPPDQEAAAQDRLRRIRPARKETSALHAGRIQRRRICAARRRTRPPWIPRNSHRPVKRLDRYRMHPTVPLHSHELDCRAFVVPPDRSHVMQLDCSVVLQEEVRAKPNGLRRMELLELPRGCHRWCAARPRHSMRGGGLFGRITLTSVDWANHAGPSLPQLRPLSSGERPKPGPAAAAGSSSGSLLPRGKRCMARRRQERLAPRQGFERPP